MPGGIATRLQRHIDPEELERARREAGAGAELKTIEQGAATSIVAAISPIACRRRICGYGVVLLDFSSSTLGWPSIGRGLHVAAVQLRRLVIAMGCCPEHVLSGAGPTFSGLGLELLGRTGRERAVLINGGRQIRR
jgi:hypothetical protein